jgi:hypothetical protein
MKIKEIKLKKDSLYVYEVTFKPNLLERLFGYSEYTKEYKYTNSTYICGDGGVYIDKDGYKLGNGNWIG